jgi:hypothetical protein
LQIHFLKIVIFVKKWTEKSHMALCDQGLIPRFSGLNDVGRRKKAQKKLGIWSGDITPYSV